MPAIQIGPLSFRSKSEAKSYFRAVRDSYPDGALVSFEDAAHLRSLVGRHPEATEKIGAGIAHFTVERDTTFGTTRHFVLHRIDGTSTDFSFHTCIDGRNVRGDKLEALRREIEDQILSFRDAAFLAGPVHCPILGHVLGPNDAHVDHEPPATFMRLVDDWTQSIAIRLEDIEITPPADNQIVTRMTNSEQRSSWSRYHSQRSRLRILSRTANLSHTRRNRNENRA